MKLSLEELQSNVQSYVKARRPQMTSEAKAWRHEFLSWKSFKHFLENNLHDLCLKFILRTYVPHDDIEAKFGGIYFFFSFLNFSTFFNFSIFLTFSIFSFFPQFFEFFPFLSIFNFFFFFFQFFFFFHFFFIFISILILF